MNATRLVTALGRITVFVTGTLIAVPASAQTGAPARPAPTQIAAAVDSLADSLTRGPVVGMSVVVARGPEILLAEGYGFADREANAPADPATVYQIGSVTKQFTAAAIMRLVEQGRMSLDDGITKYLPDFPLQGHEVTIRHLLNHTSGIRSYTSFMRLTDSMPVATIYDSIKVQPFDFAPGTEYRYNNSGYVLLGMILEQVTGTPYAELMQEWFFTPLGLKDTRYCGAGGVTPPEGYRPGLMGARTRVPAVDMRVPFSAGAICSTAPDLARWTWALAAGKVVTPESFAAMTGGSTLSTGRRISYGYGLVSDSAHGQAIIHHGGSIPGFLSEAAFYPADSTIVVVLVNTETAMGLITERVHQIALGVKSQPVRDMPIDAAEMARVAGTYALGNGAFEIRVFEADGQLMAQGSNQGAFRLLWQGGGEYRAVFDRNVRLVFAGGTPAEAFVLHQGGMAQRAVRKAE